MKGVLQLADAHSLNMGFQYATKDSKNENVGDFALPERASRTQKRITTWSISAKYPSFPSEPCMTSASSGAKIIANAIPSAMLLAIMVKDAFKGGGAQNRNRTDGNTYELSNLIYFAGEKLTMRSGFQGWHRRESSLSQDNFFGEFTFSDLASYRAGKPLKYRITCCDPLFRMSQTQVAFFSQNDFKLTNTFTLMLGARYQLQTNIHDRNNVDPRIGFAYAIGNATVIRGGAGVFTQWFADLNDIQTFRRLDGKRLYEIQIDNPGWPDPFASGSVRPRSRRVVEPNMKAAIITMANSAGAQPAKESFRDRSLRYQLRRQAEPNPGHQCALPGTGIRPSSG